MDKPTAYLFAEGHRELGYGHISRMLALATMISDAFDPKFICSESDNTAVSRITDSGFDHNSAVDPNAIDSADVAVLDGYHYTEDHAAKLRSHNIPILQILDFEEGDLLGDAILNHGLLEEKAKFDVDQQLLGPKYALVHPDFYKLKGESGDHILICLGGAMDDDDLQDAIIIIQSVYPNSNIDLVVYDAPEWNDDIDVDRIQIHTGLNRDQMIRLMANSSFAVLSASTVAMEYLNAHKPAFLIPTIDNQMNIFDGLVQRKLAADFNDFPMTENIDQEEVENTFDGTQSQRLIAFLNDFSNTAG